MHIRRLRRECILSGQGLRQEQKEGEEEEEEEEEEERRREQKRTQQTPQQLARTQQVDRRPKSKKQMQTLQGGPTLCGET